MKQIKLHTTEKQRLDEFLRKKLPFEIEKLLLESKKDKNLYVVSNSKIRRLILSGAVKVNKSICTRPAFELRNSSFIEINFDEEKFFFEKQPEDIKFNVTQDSVLYEDENLIFINKPAFFPVEQTITGNRDNLHDSTVEFLWKRSPQLRNPPYVGIMHRLDKDTSGIILFTKNRAINKQISQLFSNHDLEKEYYAVCEIKSKRIKELEKSFVVEKFIGRISGKTQACKWGTLPQEKGGLFSKTEFKIVREITLEGKNCIEIKCKLHTGRTHQIRVHLSELGFPILGDELYGGDRAKRMYLHATHLKSDFFDITAPLPW